MIGDSGKKSLSTLSEARAFISGFKPINMLDVCFKNSVKQFSRQIVCSTGQITI